MALSHATKVYAFEDAKIAQLLTDPDGGSATYGNQIDIPGVKSLGTSPEFNNVELRGDNRLLDSNTTLQGVTITVEHAKLSLDALEVILGGTATDSGTTPNQVATFARAGDDNLNYFKLEGKTPPDGGDTIGGDVHLVFHKLILSNWEFGLAEEDYQIFSFEARAIPLTSSGEWFDVVLNETETAITIGS